MNRMNHEKKIRKMILMNRMMNRMIRMSTNSLSPLSNLKSLKTLKEMNTLKKTCYMILMSLNFLLLNSVCRGSNTALNYPDGMLVIFVRCCLKEHF